MKMNKHKDIIDIISRIRVNANLLIEQELNSRGHNGILPAHGMVFSYLFKQQGPVPITALVKQSGRAKSTVTGIVKTLERHGYLYKETSPDDGRSFHIGLTERGWSIKKDFEEISDILQEKVYMNINEDDREYLTNLLMKIEQNLR